MQPNSAPVSLLIRGFRRETVCEFLKLFRLWAFSVSMVALPVMLYGFIGIGGVHNGFLNALASRYMVATYCTFGLLGTSLVGISIGISNERSTGWIDMRRLTPSPALAYVMSKCLSVSFFAVVITWLIVLMGYFGAHVSFSFVNLLALTLVAVLGTIPFSALGVFLGLVAPPNAVPGMANLLYLPLSFSAGFLLPFSLLPHALQAIAPWNPAYCLGRIALYAIGLSPKLDQQDVTVLMVFAGLILIADLFAWRQSFVAA